jgi:predicted glycosyltransferase
MDFSYTYAPNLIHQGGSVITEILSANGYKNSTSPNSYKVTHGPKLPQKHFQRVKNYTTSDKIKVRYDYTGCARTSTKQKRRKNAHAPDARLWSQKAVHI